MVFKKILLNNSQTPYNVHYMLPILQVQYQNHWKQIRLLFVFLLKVVTLHFPKLNCRSYRAMVAYGLPISHILFLLMKHQKNEVLQGPVLLVCIYNQFGNVITHDYLYQLFCPYGTIVKILIFEKAKVWKTFVEYEQTDSAQKALFSLNDKIIFEDGSKLNIFRSKLRHVTFHNDNLGGVNYQQLNQQKFQDQQIPSNRKRRSTLQDYTAPFYIQQPIAQAYYNFTEKQTSLGSTQAKYKSETFSAKKSQDNSSFNNFMDIDEQFRQLALQSTEFREWQQEIEINRRKSKTLVNPNSQQFLLQNCPSKVLFVRSLPEHYDHDCLYHIFCNFGRVSKVIYLKQKGSALVQFQTLLSAIQAKDQINYAKPVFKVFYSHYESLILKKLNEDEEEHEYRSQGLGRIINCNPPSQILYMTFAHPKVENEIRSLCEKLQCPIVAMDWKQNNKQKWMCLVQFSSLNDSMYVMGRLQNYELSTGKKLRLSFTRSKMSQRSHNY